MAPRITDIDKIDFLLAVLRFTPSKPNLAALAAELSMNMPTVDARLRNIKKESAQRLQAMENGNGGKATGKTTPIKKTSTPSKKSDATPSKRKRVEDEDDDEADDWLNSVEVEGYFVKTEAEEQIKKEEP